MTGAPLPLRAAAAAMAAALAAALILPDARLGAGLVPVVALVAAAVLVADPSGRLRAPRSDDPHRSGGGIRATLGLIAVALACAPLLRDAAWVIAIDLVAAVAFGALAAASPTTWRATERVVRAFTARTFGAWFALVYAVVERLTFGRIRRALPAVRGAALAGVLIVVFGALFVSADAAFAEVVNDALPQWRISSVPDRVLVGGLIGALAGALALTAFAPRLGTDPPIRERIGVTEWTTALAALDLLFAAFIAVQLTVFFGGHHHVLTTAGLTYAEYARQGFGELMAVAGLTLGVVALAVTYGRRGGRRDERRMQILLGVLCALALVVLVSALRRLGLYEDAFGFTRARLFAHAVILWLGALIVLVAVSGAVRRGALLPRLALMLTGVALAAFTLLNPDGVVAQHNIDRFQSTGKIDTVYLNGLSADATSALVELPPKQRAEATSRQRQRLDTPDGWRGANIARSRARAALKR